MHDDLQCAGRDVPSRLFRTAGAGGWFDTIAQAQTPGPNPTSSTSCIMNCTTTQLTCQTTCARISPLP